MNPDTMTLAEMADWCMHDDGWRHKPAGGNSYKGLETWNRFEGERHVAETYVHPFSPTLDGAASALPEGWKLFALEDVGPISGWSSSAVRHTGKTRQVFAHGKDEITTRYRLAVKARLAAKGVQA
jgi:hypothetical protein